jgi:hypothetical protein
MELMPLGSLFLYTRKNQEAIPWKNRHQLMIDLCAGMEFLHSVTFADGSAKQVLFHQEIHGSQQVSHRGGTKGYLAPELLLSHCKFNKKGDVFAAGVVFLEFPTLERPTELYDDCWPHIIEEKALPEKMKEALCQSLSEDQSKRNSFTEIRMVLEEGGDDICRIVSANSGIAKRHRSDGSSNL